MSPSSSGESFGTAAPPTALREGKERWRLAGMENRPRLHSSAAEGRCYAAIKPQSLKIAYSPCRESRWGRTSFTAPDERDAPIQGRAETRR